MAQPFTATFPERMEEHADDEAALIAAARNDPLAFGAIYQRYGTRVYRYCRSRTATEEDAADLTQQIFLQALTALPRYRERGTPFAGWLFRIARNVLNDHYRRQKTTTTWEGLPEALQPVATDGPEHAAIGREALGQLGTALIALPTDRRELLSLRFGAQLSIREIATAIGKSEAAVQRQLHRTLQTLKECYDAH